MQFLFKKYVEYENSLGDEERIESVKRKAMEYVESTLGWSIFHSWVSSPLMQTNQNQVFIPMQSVSSSKCQCAEEPCDWTAERIYSIGSIAVGDPCMIIVSCQPRQERMAPNFVSIYYFWSQLRFGWSKREKYMLQLWNVFFCKGSSINFGPWCSMAVFCSLVKQSTHVWVMQLPGLSFGLMLPVLFVAQQSK